jgi:glycosyltransferase involved in cell wall biosynthesis
MTIAFVTTEYITEKNFAGGLSNYLYKITQALHEKGFKPVIIVSSNCTEKIVHENIDVYRVHIKYNRVIVYLLTKIIKPLFRINLYPAFTFVSQSYLLNRELKRLSKQCNIDIIQYSSYMATGFFRVKGIPGIVRISSLEALWRKAYDIKFDVVKDTNLTVQTLTDYFEIKAIKNADAVFGPSKYIGEKVGAISKKKVEIIESPYLPTEFQKDYTEYNRTLLGKPYFLFYGAVGTMKGVHIIARIVYRLFLKYPEFNFVFVGKDRGFGNQSMIDYVKECAGEFQDKIIYFPQLKHSQLFPIIEHSMAVVLPSRVDNFPNTCIEAFSLKKIVLGTRGASFEQLINNEENGFLCNIEDADDLWEMLIQIINLDPLTRSKIEMNAYKRLEVMSMDVISEQHVKFYQSVCFCNTSAKS